MFGSGGAIGASCVEAVLQRYPDCTVHAMSRSGGSFGPSVKSLAYDPDDEVSLRETCRALAESGSPDLVIIATGILHEEGIVPEKSLRDIEPATLHRLFAVNTILPAMIVKHLAPLMDRKRPYTLAVLSARVGSISDNRLGGWYSYRISKAALNMFVRTASIELTRQNSQSIVVGLHPGTVDSALSEPFRSSVPPDKLFAPEFAAESLLDVIERLKPTDSGGCFDWAGKPVPA